MWFWYFGVINFFRVFILSRMYCTYLLWFQTSHSKKSTDIYKFNCLIYV